jgi:hypothetical protein
MFDTFLYIHKWLLGWWNVGGMLSSFAIYPGEGVLMHHGLFLYS